MDQTGVLSKLLRKAYLQREIELELTDEEGFRDRQAKYHEEGLYFLNRIIDKGLVAVDLPVLLNLTVTDPFFNPMNKLRQGSFFAIARAKAIEKSLYGSTTDEVVELAMLLSLFTNLFDEILDEAPHILSPADLAFIHNNLTRPLWAESYVLPTIPPDPDRNPFATLLLEIMVSIIGVVTRQPVWSSDPVLKDQFLKASMAAFIAEKESTKSLDLTMIPSDIVAAENTLQLKSINWAWAVSLAPACVHGWPKDVTESDFEAFTRSLGIFGGWIDDLSDMSRDYTSNKWNNVFCKIFKLLSFLPSTRTDFPAMIRNCMADEGVVRHLTQIGIDYHLDVLRKAEHIARDVEPIEDIVSDTVLLFLSDAHYSPDAITFPDYA